MPDLGPIIDLSGCWDRCWEIAEERDGVHARDGNYSKGRVQIHFEGALGEVVLRWTVDPRLPLPEVLTTADDGSDLARVVDVKAKVYMGPGLELQIPYRKELVVPYYALAQIDEARRRGRLVGFAKLREVREAEIHEAGGRFRVRSRVIPAASLRPLDELLRVLRAILYPQLTALNDMLRNGGAR